MKKDFQVTKFLTYLPKYTQMLILFFRMRLQTIFLFSLHSSFAKFPYNDIFFL